MLALTYMTQVLQMAYGWTRLLVISQALALLVLVPTLIIMIDKWDIAGAASAVVLVLSAYSVVVAYIAHIRLFPRMTLKWVSDYIAPSVIANVIIIASVKLVFAGDEFNFYDIVIQILTAFALSIAVAIMLSGEFKAFMLATLRK